jgi:hypothetical protein
MVNAVSGVVVIPAECHQVTDHILALATPVDVVDVLGTLAAVLTRDEVLYAQACTG